jgi:predicted ATPase/DNA-binding CsgD family transcriptional regulator
MMVNVVPKARDSTDQTGDEMNSLDEQPLLDSLTERELEVLRLMVDGLSNREIALELVVTLGTAQWYSKQIYSKLGVHSRKEAISKATVLGLPGAPPDRSQDTPGPSRRTLPAPVTPFVGRDRELSELHGLLAENRLVTITGPGGIGKTRLALEVALHQLGRFADNVYFVDFAALTHPKRIISTVANTTGLQFQPDGREPKQQLLDFLRNRHMLLVMDNFEHLLDGAVVVSEILGAAPDVQVLATSRERLNLSGETVFNLEGMDLPDWKAVEEALEYSAVKLFMQSARRTSPGFDVQTEDLTYIATICHLVEGMPLGIMLAAAWVELLSLEEIVDEMRQSIDFLATKLRDVPERHRSMHAVLRSTWDRLDDDERAVFMRLSLFRGGFIREAAQAVAGVELRQLNTLVSKSLLNRNPETGRYEGHTLLRQYAEAKLAEIPKMREESADSHAAYYAEFIQQREDIIWRGGERQVLPDIENIRLAWHWMVAHRMVAEIRKSLIGLFFFYEVSGWWVEAAAEFEQAANQLRVDKPDGEMKVVLGSILTIQSYFCRRAGLTKKSLQVGREGFSMLRRSDANELLAWSYLQLQRQGMPYGEDVIADLEESRRLLQQGLRIFEEAENQLGIACTLNTLGNVTFDQKDYQQAKAYYEQGLSIEEHRNAPRGAGWALWGLANVAIASGEYREAKRYIGELFSLEEVETGSRRAFFLKTLGEIDYHLGHYREAVQHFREILQVVLNESISGQLALEAIVWLSEINIQHEASELDVEVLAFVQHHPQCTQELKDQSVPILNELEANLGTEAYIAAWERSKALDFEVVVQRLLEVLDIRHPGTGR